MSQFSLFVVLRLDITVRMRRIFFFLLRFVNTTTRVAPPPFPTPPISYSFILDACLQYGHLVTYTLCAVIGWELHTHSPKHDAEKMQA